MQIYLMPDGNKRQYEPNNVPEGAIPINVQPKAIKAEEEPKKVVKKAIEETANKAVKTVKNKAVKGSKK